MSTGLGNFGRLGLPETVYSGTQYAVLKLEDDSIFIASVAVLLCRSNHYAL
jgi:hypothetical protein